MVLRSKSRYGWKGKKQSLRFVQSVCTSAGTLVWLVHSWIFQQSQSGANVGNNRVNFPIQTNKWIFSALVIIQITKFLHNIHWYLNVTIEEHNFTLFAKEPLIIEIMQMQIIRAIHYNNSFEQKQCVTTRFS